MTQIVVSMVVIVLVAGVVAAYVAFPHRGEDLPGAPWLGRLMRKGARSLPTVEPEPGDVMPSDGGSPEQPGETGVGAVPETTQPRVQSETPGQAPGQHRA